MDGWVDGWMDGWMDGWVDGWMDGWIWMGVWRDGCVRRENVEYMKKKTHRPLPLMRDDLGIRSITSVHDALTTDMVSSRRQHIANWANNSPAIYACTDD